MLDLLAGVHQSSSAPVEEIRTEKVEFMHTYAVMLVTWFDGRLVDSVSNLRGEGQEKRRAAASKIPELQQTLGVEDDT